MSSYRGDIAYRSGPGDRLVAQGPGFEAAVPDADEAVGELAQRGVVLYSAGADLVVVGACPW